MMQSALKSDFKISSPGECGTSRCQSSLASFSGQSVWSRLSQHRMEWSGSCLECRCWLFCWCTLSWLVFPNVGEFADTWWNLWNATQIINQHINRLRNHRNMTSNVAVAFLRSCADFVRPLIRMCYWMCCLGQQVSMESGNLMLLSSIWVEMTGGHWHTKAQCRDASWYLDISTIHIGLDIRSWRRPLSHGTPGEESLIAGFARFLRHLREHRGCSDSDSLGNHLKNLDFDIFDIQIYLGHRWSLKLTRSRGGHLHFACFAQVDLCHSGTKQWVALG